MKIQHDSRSKETISHYDLHKAGKLSEKEAKTHAKNIIKKMRYGPDGKDYFRIHDFESGMVMHPYVSRLDGKDLSGKMDKKGKLLFIEMTEVCKKFGAGHVPYFWQKYDDSTWITEKISYVKAFKPWGWIVGTSVYLVD
ncbi:MAG: hypothetical protein GY754_45420 [bacterium]|nr:hypothetical protein [bacterium]